jgi:DNA-binding IclR family transcriptional regulator
MTVKAAAGAPTRAIDRDAPVGAARSRYTVQSLVVGMRVLEALAKSGGLKGVTELAQELGTTKWVVFRHLQTLCAEGFAVRDPASEKYEVGRRLHALQDALPPRFAWVQRAREDMHRLRQEVGLTVAVAGLLRDGSGVKVIDVEAGSRDVLFTLKIGAVFDFHASAHGKTALAFGDPALMDRVMSGALPKYAPKTITSPEALRREIRKLRERGWADAPEQAEPKMNAVTAPIFSAQSLYEGSIGIFGSIDQIPAEPPSYLIRAVLDAARRVSRRLGGP